MKPLNSRPRAKAQSLTELALMMPLLALMLVGLIELGFLLHAHVQVSSAAREAARAASLYRANRFSAFTDAQLGNFNNTNGLECVTNIPGWTLQQTIEQAVVRRATNANNCPTNNGTIVYSALGRLDPAAATAGPTLTTSTCPTTNVGGWVVGITSSTPAYTQSSTNPSPPAGGRATLTLCYPHRMIIASGLLNLGDPIWVNKSVVFQYQQ